ncbi:ATP-binding protein [Aestuariibacter sp. AA17]|uniref:ATP-binding protein n=1 Tax=Fluctibacter corallii TaxID=2984329 RepID=A0ABT3AC80_9ALTE|nr:ATP-binding protein [Aestuariibacter sp. AA17]MCV2885892.1 ATP-binding protein [Aestuariibacter sp. AA17]
MVASLSFQTRARTIDHLGREQIADCPTAISELWKNAYDAYARSVSLNIYDGDFQVATLVDDGHGMTITDIEQKWLIVGTESKAVSSELSESDKNGIEKVRVKQGQKGIGRLSSAALGSLLLLMSKKKNEKFVACLLDWRLFENPYLMLHDIQLPIMEFETRSELPELLPSMFDKLMGNLWGDGLDSGRDKRVEAAWSSYHEQELEEGKDQTTKELIEETVIDEAFSERHFESWPVWNGKSSNGTAMIIGNINDDLIAQLSSDSGSELEGSDKRAKENFQQTLASFINPLTREGENRIDDFEYRVIAHNGSMQRDAISDARSFGIEEFDQLEHTIEGKVDEQGIFNGRVKAFGVWYEDVTVKPKVRYKTRKDTRFGPFDIRLGTFEILKKNTSLSDVLHTKLLEQTVEFAGLMVHRDHLRVMPYGRENNDFFEIEKRRTKNAGRYIFSNRNIFGGVCISKYGNPNLKDKAGREGIIDNKASKLFKEIVENILVDIADRFLGRYSQIRVDSLAELNKKHAEEKASEDRKKLLKKEQNRIRAAINKNTPQLTDILLEVNELVEQLESRLSLNSQDEIIQIRHVVTDLQGRLKELSLSPIPKSLGSVENAYREYRDSELNAYVLIKNINTSLNESLEKLTVKQDIDIAEKDFRSKAAVLHSKINKYATEGRSLLKTELSRFDEELSLANKRFHKELSNYLDDLAAGRTDLATVTNRIEDEYQKQDVKINQQFKPYLTAIESIRNQIDLEGLALHSLNENSSLKKEVERMNSLAQLGISVEIIGHEIEGIDMTIANGLSYLKESALDAKQLEVLNSVLIAHQSLSDSWRFLSTLKLSGEKIKSDISGHDIFQYVKNFFGKRLENNDIEFNCTDDFLNLSIFEQPSRIYPVFINLINNARYWVKHTECEKRLINIDFKNGKVIVSDNGPGVDIDDVDSLFTLFFTRKQRGGRGVGLYLCRMNLQAGGHDIYYEKDPANKVLEGANFIVSFQGVERSE